MIFRKDTLSRWTSPKDLLWISDFRKIKVLYCTGNGFIEVYKNDSFTCFTTCIDFEDFEKYKHIFNAKIKYLRGIDEDGFLTLILWNTRKLNKIYGVQDRWKRSG